MDASGRHEYPSSDESNEPAPAAARAHPEQSTEDLTALALSRAAGIEAPNIIPPIRRELTPREKDVLELIVQGKNDKAISTSLTITEGSVGVYVGDILNKTRANNREKAAVVAVHYGLVPSENFPLSNEEIHERLATLTEAELAVLEFIPHGLRAREIGERLGVEARSVDRIVGRIKKKFDTKSRVILAVAAYKADLMKPLESDEFAEVDIEELWKAEGLIKTASKALKRRLDDREVQQQPIEQATKLDESLTTREIQILMLQRGGIDNKEIAEEFGVSQKALSGEIKQLYTKLQVKNKEQAILAGQFLFPSGEVAVTINQRTRVINEIAALLDRAGVLLTALRKAERGETGRSNLLTTTVEKRIQKEPQTATSERLKSTPVETSLIAALNIDHTEAEKHAEAARSQTRNYVLKRFAEGISRRRISYELSIQQPALATLIREIKDYYDVETIEEAIDIALVQGDIARDDIS